MSSNYVAELISCARSGRKACRTRDPVTIATTVGYAAKALAKTAELKDTKIGQYTSELLDTFAKTTDTSKVGGFAKEVLDVAKHSDEIGMIRSTVKAVKSDSMARVLIEEGFGWLTRYIFKETISTYGGKLLNIKGIKPISDGIINFSKNTKGFGQVPNIISGVAYTMAKDCGKKFGKYIGKRISDGLKIPLVNHTTTNTDKTKFPREISSSPLR